MRVYYEICRAGNNYNGFAPHFPGCLAAGDTVAETRERLLRALASHIQSEIDDGEPMPAEPVEMGHMTVDVREPAAAK